MGKRFRVANWGAVQEETGPVTAQVLRRILSGMGQGGNEGTILNVLRTTNIQSGAASIQIPLRLIGAPWPQLIMGYNPATLWYLGVDQDGNYRIQAQLDTTFSIRRSANDSAADRFTIDNYDGTQQFEVDADGLIVVGGATGRGSALNLATLSIAAVAGEAGQAPDQFTSLVPNLLSWYRVEDITGVADGEQLANADPTWIDKASTVAGSANNDASMNSVPTGHTGGGPTYRDNVSYHLNGYPVIEANASGPTGFGGSGDLDSSGRTWIVVYRAVAGTSFLIGSISGTTEGIQFPQVNASATGAIWFLGTSYSLVTPFDNTTGYLGSDNWHIGVVRSDGNNTTFSYRHDGTNRGNFNGTPSLTSAEMYFFTARENGLYPSASGSRVVEVICYNAKLTDAQVEEIEQYLVNKYFATESHLAEWEVDGTVDGRITSSGSLGVGTSSPSAKTHVLSVTEQLRLAYDASNYASFTVGSGGNLTIDPTGELIVGTGVDVFIGETLPVKPTNLTQGIGATRTYGALLWGGTSTIDYSGFQTQHEAGSWPTTGGYGALMSHNVYWDHANNVWRQPRGTSTNSKLFSVGYHSDFSWLHAAAGASDDGAVTLTEWMTLDSTGLSLLQDTYRTYWGADKDCAIYWSGSSMVVEPKLGGSGALIVAGNATLQVQGSVGDIELAGASGGNIINFTRGGVNVISAGTASGTVEFRVNGSSTTVGKFVSNGLQFDDNIRAIFGSGSDAYIQYTGATLQILSPGSSGSLQFLAAGAYGTAIDGSSGDITFSGTVAIDQTQVRFQERTNPSTPASTKGVLFLSSSTGELSIRKDDGSIVSLESTLSAIAVKGSSYIFGCAPTVTASRYMNFGNTIATSTVGMVMPRAGSITGVSFSINASVISTAGTIDLEVHKNGTNVFSTQITTTGATGQYQSYAVQDSNIDNFTEGDELALYINFGTFSGTLSLTHGLIEYVIAGDTAVNIGELADVDVTTLSDNDVLIYDSASQTWLPGPQTGGGGAYTPVAVSTATLTYTGSSQDVLLLNCSSGQRWGKLPAPSSGAELILKKVDSSSNVATLLPNAAETIDGASSVDVSAQYDTVHVVSDGTNWHVINTPALVALTTGTVQTHHLIARKNGTGASGTISFTTISGTYKHLILRIWGKSDVAATVDLVNVAFNSDTTAANYRATQHYGGATAHSAASVDGRSFVNLPGASSPTGYVGMAEALILQYANTALHKVAEIRNAERRDASTEFIQHRHVHWENTAAITQIDLALASGNWTTDSVVELIGVAEANVVLTGFLGTAQILNGMIAAP